MQAHKKGNLEPIDANLLTHFGTSLPQSTYKIRKYFVAIAVAKSMSYTIGMSIRHWSLTKNSKQQLDFKLKINFYKIIK